MDVATHFDTHQPPLEEASMSHGIAACLLAFLFPFLLRVVWVCLRVQGGYVSTSVQGEESQTSGSRTRMVGYYSGILIWWPCVFRTAGWD